MCFVFRWRRLLHDLLVVIGYGIIASVMTTDIDLSERGGGAALRIVADCRERVPAHLYLEPLSRVVAPATYAGAAFSQRRCSGTRRRNGVGAYPPAGYTNKKVERATGIGCNYGGVVANSYLPSNWLSACRAVCWAQVDESDNNSLINPAGNFTYVALEG